MRVVLDTNTIISGIGWEGPPRRVLLGVREGLHRLVISPALLDELTAVLKYPKLRSIAVHPLLPEILSWLHQVDHLVYPAERLDQIKEDLPDNLVLEAAVAGSAERIVSGDHHLLALRQFRGIAIMTARTFEQQYLPSVHR